MTDVVRRPTGQQLRDEAVQRVTEGADPDWMEDALVAVEKTAQWLATFTTDDVWQALQASDESTTERRAMGAVMRRAEGAGWIEPTDEYRESERPEAHRNPKRVWRSLLTQVETSPRSAPVRSLPTPLPSTPPTSRDAARFTRRRRGSKPVKHERTPEEKASLERRIAKTRANDQAR